jgi:predicted dehydrogenase
VIMRYLVNAGPLDAGSWYLDEQSEGSRFVGEGGHFIDLMSAWADAPPVRVDAVQPRDGADLQVAVTFEDGSLGTLTYTTVGSRRAPKETFDCTGGGRSAQLDNFTRATVWGSGGGKDVKRTLGGPDKGQPAALDAFLAAVRTGSAMPIPFASLVATTRATLAAHTSVQGGQPVNL